MPEFVSLTQWFTAPSEPVAELPPIVNDETSEVPVVEDIADDVDAALADALIFRATLEEAIEVRAKEVAREIAIEVLARELQLAPCDLAAVAARARERYHMRDLLEIRVHPSDAPALDGNVCVVCDETLRRGDVVLTASCGSIDAALGVRLDRILRAMR